METTNHKLVKRLNIVAYILTAIILSLVGMMRRVKFEVDFDTSILPAISASINTVTAILLLMALWFIKQKRVQAHRNMIYGALVASFFFLLCYVLYHFTTVETSYCKEGILKTIYFIILISHIILAGVIFPFILFTFIRGFTGQVERHKRMAKWVWPIWFYVAITGPIIYLMLKPCYS